jgi:hypothetical protein
MSGASPLVSAVIPTYNRADMVEAAVRSALNQTYDALEVLVVDDGSSDDTVARLAAFGEPVRVIRHDTNRGAAAARNTGIAEARGEYVALLDSDDLWEPDKTARQLDFMRDRRLVMCCTGFRSVYAPGSAPLTKPRPYGELLALEDLLWGVYVAPGSTLIARRQRLLELGGYDTTLPRLEDWDLLLRAVMVTGELGFLDEELALLHPSPGPEPATLTLSAGLLVERGVAVLAGETRRTRRRFRAGVAFEVAAALWKAGDRARSLAWLARSLALAPIGHQSIRIILLPWLRARLRGERRAAGA